MRLYVRLDERDLETLAERARHARRHVSDEAGLILEHHIRSERELAPSADSPSRIPANMPPREGVPNDRAA
jgi:hypothetical protein